MGIEISVREVRYMYPHRKELQLTVDGLEAPLEGRLREIRHDCTYEVFDQVKGWAGASYQLTVGKLGPFLTFYYLRPEPDPKWPDMPPWLHAKTAEGIVPLWLGLWAGIRDVKLGIPELGRYVDIDYRATPHMGNLFRTCIEADALRELLEAQPELGWHLEDHPYRKNTAVAVVTHKQPHEVRRDIYPSAHGKGLWGANLRWCEDEGQGFKDIWFGACWPTEKDVAAAMDHFAESGEQRVCANVNHLRAMFPEVEIQPDWERH